MSQACYFFKFYLFVTGRGEEKHLHNLFRRVANTGICQFEVARRISQLDSITSKKRVARMVGSGKELPDKVFEAIGIPARRCIQQNPCTYVILIDDLEYHRHQDATNIFGRYRQALDIGLGENKHKASVHFLVNMLEAYFFAHFEATNSALELPKPLSQYMGDVEEIRNPKARLREYLPNYDEVSDAGEVLDVIDLDVILADRDNCAWLRSCVKWIVDVLEQYPNIQATDISAMRSGWHLDDGKVSPLTANQRL